jgi:hypothetical protein
VEQRLLRIEAHEVRAQHALIIIGTGSATEEPMTTPIESSILDCDAGGGANCVAIYPDGADVTVVITLVPGHVLDAVVSNCGGSQQDDTFGIGGLSTECMFNAAFVPVAAPLVRDAGRSRTPKVCPSHALDQHRGS